MWGMSAVGTISKGTAWSAGCGPARGFHSLPPVPLRNTHGGLPDTVPPAMSSRMGNSPLAK